MLLIILLIIPIAFWLIPLSALKQQDNNVVRKYILNFTAMLFTLLIIGLILWQLNMDSTTLAVILLCISAAWGALYHLIFTKSRF